MQFPLVRFFRLVSALALLPLCARAESEPKPLELDNEVVCRVNTEAISKRDVEDRMELIAIKLRARQKQLRDADQWTPEIEKEWNGLYIPAFRDALRRVVRERLMLQGAKAESVKVDEKLFERRYQEKMKELREQNLIGPDGMSPAEVNKRMRERATIDTFRSRFYSFLENPTRPEVEQYYKNNLNRYQRKAGVKVRIIRIDRFITDKFTNKQTVRENSFELAEELRKDIVKYGANFAEVAKTHSDDLESRARGGLIQLDAKDDYFEPDAYNKQLSNAINGLKVGDVSKVFELGQSSWAFALVEDVRQAGPAPLDNALFDEIYKTLSDLKSSKKDDEWFRKALSKSLIVHVVEGTPKQLPIDFFFPEEKEKEAAPKVKTEPP